jgi:hypothetical protein
MLRYFKKQDGTMIHMTKYIYRITKLTFVIFLTFGFIVISASSAFAQYRGAYPGQGDAREKEKLEIIVPQIFSSQVSSVAQAKKLDEVYDGLYATLWNYAISDFNYQKQLYELLSNDRFKTTRYSAEFSGLLKDAMTNLNENHTKMQSAVKEADRDFEYVKTRVRADDQETLDKLWESKIAEYKESANNYFKMEHMFLKTYRTMVEFILEQSGGYYYDSETRGLKFYNLGAYDYYGKALDKLHTISYEQAKLLKSHAPANMDPDLLK